MSACAKVPGDFANTVRAICWLHEQGLIVDLPTNSNIGNITSFELALLMLCIHIVLVLPDFGFKNFFIVLINLAIFMYT